MPQLDLTELEAKTLWLVLEQAEDLVLPVELWPTKCDLFEKAYRAYRGMPPQEAA